MKTGAFWLACITCGALMNGTASASCAATNVLAAEPSRVRAGQVISVSGYLLGSGRCDDTDSGCERNRNYFDRARGLTLTLLQGTRRVDLGEFEPGEESNRTKEVRLPNDLKAGSAQLEVLQSDGDVQAATVISVLP